MTENRWSLQLHKITTGILLAYALFILAFYPLYMDFEKGYYGIAWTKFNLFWRVSVSVAGLVLVLRLILAGVKRFAKAGGGRNKNNHSVTQWFCYGFGLVTLLSYLVSSFKAEAFWGTEGWYMGLVSQMLFVFLFWVGMWLTEQLKPVFISGLLQIVWPIVAAVVFVLGILNRFSIYPIHFSGEGGAVISTFGNINWYCGFVSIAMPFCIGLYCFSERKKDPIYGSLAFLGMVAGLTQGSDGIWAVFFGCLWMVWLVAAKLPKCRQKLIVLFYLFLLALFSVRILGTTFPAGPNYDNAWLRDLATTDMIQKPFLLGTGSCIVLWFLNRKYAADVRIGKWMQILLLTGTVTTILLVPFLIALNTLVEGGIWPVRGLPLFTFHDGFGNGRGAIWKDAFMIIDSLNPLQCLIGVGPDCFNIYAYSKIDLAAVLVGQFGTTRLTCAHNEWLTILINEGLLGLMTYAGIFIASMRSNFAGIQACGGITKTEEESQTAAANGMDCMLMGILMGCLLAAFCYTLYGMVSFGQILSTPFIFLLLGMAEGLTKKTDFSMIKGGFLE